MSALALAALAAALASAAPSPVRPALLVVTTERIRTGSVALELFVEEKERRGFTVRVATEADFGGAGLVGEPKAQRIRAWLQQVHRDYSFLLLIGDAHPDYGEIPMWRVWPRFGYPEDLCGGFALDCRSHATDYLYADLTGDWDLDDNGRLGETGRDEGPGGLDLEAELYVGRIPFFFDDLPELDRALRHAVAYLRQSPQEAAYRQRVLLASAFFYFEGQQLIGATSPSHVDGADTTEWFKRHVERDHPALSFTRLYEREGVVTSAWPSEGPLSREGLVAEWAKGQGLVFWNAHGLERSIGRTVWTADANGDGRAGPGEVASPTLFTSADAASVGGSRPAFVVPVSCEVGSADVPDNLAYRLLVEGAAVGLIGSSSVTPASRTDYGDLSGTLDAASLGGDNLGIRFFERLLEGDWAGRAFYDAKRELGAAGHVESLAGRTMLNYFGDPSLTWTLGAEPPVSAGASAPSAEPPLASAPSEPPPVPEAPLPPSGCSAAGGEGGLAGWLLALAALAVFASRSRLSARWGS